MKTLAFVIFLFLYLHCGAQGWSDIMLQDENYGTLLAKCEAHFDTIGRGRGTGYKQFLRWKYIMDGRTGLSQKIENFSAKNFTAYESLRRNHAQSRSHTGNWENVGPFDQYGSDVWSSGGMGRVTCMAFHPANPSIFWVGTAAGGIWKTTTGGDSWTPMTDAFPSIGITSIVVDQTNANIIYILTGDGNAEDANSVGVLKTTDGGITWNTTDLTFLVSQKKFGRVLVAHPTNPNILFAGFRSGGMYKTINGGADFTQVIGDSTIWDIEFIPGDPNHMLAASLQGLRRSTNGGNSWTIDNDPDFPATWERMDVAICPSAPNVVYVIFNGETNINGTYRGCFRSTDFGSNFTMMSNTPNIFGWELEGSDGDDQGARDLSFIVDPNNSSRIFAGGVNIWKSEDQGVTWSRESWWTHNFVPIDPFVHADQQHFYWKGNALYTVNDGGIFKTTDLGNSWTDLSEGLAIGQFYEIDILNQEYIGGLQDNGSMEGDYGNPQSHQIAGGDGFGCTWHTGDNSIMYLSTQASLIRRQFGSNIIIWNGFGEFAFWETEIEMHKTNPDYFFADRGDRLFRAHQVSAIWDYEFEDLGTHALLPPGEIRGYVQGTSNTNVMYVINPIAIIKTTNLNATDPTWVWLIPPDNAVEFSDITIDPNNSNRVWVVCSLYDNGKKVFYSSNGGSTWQNISGSIENVPIRTIEYKEGSEAGVYIGTEIGLYYRGDDMEDWIPFANYFPNTIVTDIEIRGNYLYAATHGRGIWRSPTYTDCPVNLNLSSATDPGNPLSIGTQFFYASNNITSTRIMSGGLGTDVHYFSGNQTDLLPGFEVHSGVLFEIKIDGCPD